MNLSPRNNALAVGLLIGLGFGSLKVAAAAETASFLKVSPGARPIGMGNAFTAVADDLNALAWNPAGLSGVKQREAAFMHAELFEGTRYDYMGYAHPIGSAARGASGQSTLAFGLARLSQDPIGGRAADRSATGSFDASDSAFQAAFSRPIGRRGPSVGASVKFLQSQLAGHKAQGYAFDLGVKHGLHAGGMPVFLGASAMNLGPGLEFIDEKNNLPMTLSVGAGVQTIGAFLISADIRHRPQSGETVFGLGTEYAMLSALTLRAGYGANIAADGADIGASASSPLAGMGMGLGLKVGRASLDYSVAPSGELGTAQRVSLTTRF